MWLWGHKMAGCIRRVAVGLHDSRLGKGPFKKPLVDALCDTRRSLLALVVWLWGHKMAGCCIL